MTCVLVSLGLVHWAIMIASTPRLSSPSVRVLMNAPATLVPILMGGKDYAPEIGGPREIQQRKSLPFFLYCKREKALISDLFYDQSHLFLYSSLHNRFHGAYAHSCWLATLQGSTVVFIVDSAIQARHHVFRCDINGQYPYVGAL